MSPNAGQIRSYPQVTRPCATIGSPVDKPGRSQRAAHSAIVPPLVTRLHRRHRLAPGRLLLGLVDDAGYVRDTSCADIGPLFSDASPGQVALALRVITSTLDLRRRNVLRLCAVICRSGPVVWLPADARARQSVQDEAHALGLRAGEVFVLSEAGWRDDTGQVGASPRLAPVQPSPWNDGSQ